MRRTRNICWLVKWKRKERAIKWPPPTRTTVASSTPVRFICATGAGYECRLFGWRPIESAEPTAGRNVAGGLVAADGADHGRHYLNGKQQSEFQDERQHDSSRRGVQ